MSAYSRIVECVPFFSHMTSDEAALFSSSCEKINLSCDDEIDLSGEKNFFIIAGGIMERRAPSGKGESQFLTKGAFFGNIPFASSHPKGSLRAVGDAMVLCVSAEEIVRLLSASYKSLRAYHSSVLSFGYDQDFSEGAKKLCAAKIISVCGSRGSGRSFAASLLAKKLSLSGRVLIADLSDGMVSVFDNFNAKITPPISQREKSITSSLCSLACPVSESISLLNISFSCKVATDSQIIAPALFALSSFYDYIILDLPSGDHDVVSSAIGGSDYVLAVAKNKKELKNGISAISAMCTDGQKLLPVVNSRFSPKITASRGVYLLEDFSTFSFSGDDPSSACIDSISSLVLAKRRALFLPPAFSESPVYLAFLAEAFDAGIHFDIGYSTFLPYLLLSCAIQCRSSAEIVKKASAVLSDIFLNSSLDLKFPQESISSSKGLVRSLSSVFSDMAHEEFSGLLCAKCVGERSSIVLSSGSIVDSAAAAMSVYPFHDAFPAAGRNLFSSFGLSRQSAAEMRRWGADELWSVTPSVNGSSSMMQNVLPFYRNYCEALSASADDSYFSAGFNIFVDLSFDGNNLSRFIESARSVVRQKLEELRVDK